MTLERRRRDLVVIGAGLAGCEIAAAAHAQGADVLVVEAGPRRAARHIAASPATAHLEDRDADPDFRPFFDPPPGGAFASAGYRRRVGGRSLYWRGIVLPIEESALADWPKEVRDALLAPADQPGSYADTLRELASWGAAQDPAVAARPREDALVARLRAAGLRAQATPRAIRRLPGGRWEAYSALDRVPADRVLADTRVGGIEPLVGGGYRVRHGDGGWTEADAVVVAAGAIPGIGLVDRLLRREGRDRPRGYGVYDHVATGCVLFEPGRPVPGDDVGEASAWLGFRPSARSNLFVEETVRAEGVLRDVWTMGEQPYGFPALLEVTPDGSRVGLGGAAATAVREVQEAQRGVVEDLTALLGVRTADHGTDGYGDAERRALRDPGTAYVYREQLGDLDHESGGLALGGGLVDPSGCVVGRPGLYVSGTALFPRTGAANPSLTTLSLARRQAALIAAADRQPRT